MVRLLTFDVDERRFAVLAAAVRAVVRAVAVTTLPKAPTVVEGLINFRGALVPVLDIRRRIGVGPLPLSLDQHFVIARSGPRTVALRVDRVVDLVSVGETAIAAAPSVLPGIEQVSGIATLPDGLIVIHDLDRFLSLEEADQVDAALTAAQPLPHEGVMGRAHP